ncbi:hypothetical protein PI124_g11499 [Phytophthora idaei]|nr:hypothetical protein PI125_g13909 [Phytophthora idaei]KAG3153180.1 hypothetical protein PI126_g10199 [Phytophthora idaei]KAG3243708.1 hypothetical protein PI124_g11499 [Phytophthora idaei]
MLRLEGLACCNKQCLVGKRAQLTQLVASLRSMSKEEQRTLLFTTIVMCAAAAELSRSAKKTKTSA